MNKGCGDCLMLEDISCRIVGIVLLNTTLSSTPLPCGSRVKENFRLISEQKLLIFTKSIFLPNASKLDNSKTQRRKTSLLKSKK